MPVGPVLLVQPYVTQEMLEIMKFLRLITIYTFAILLAGTLLSCSSRLPSDAEISHVVGTMSNTELSLLLHRLDASGKKNTAAYDDVFAAAQLRGTLEAADIVRMTNSRSFIGANVFSRFAVRGMPTHIATVKLTRGGYMDILYYYESAFIAEQREVAFVSNRTVVGFAELLRSGNNFRWSTQGTTTDYWRAPASLDALFDVPDYIQTCGPIFEKKCLRMLEARFG